MLDGLFDEKSFAVFAMDLPELSVSSVIENIRPFKAFSSAESLVQNGCDCKALQYFER